MVEGSQVLIVKFIEVVEFKIRARRPVETFLGEFVLVGVGNAQADVVVVGNAFDSAPEEQLLKVSLLRSVQQVLNTVLEVEFLFDIQADSVVVRELKRCIQVKNVHFA